MVRFMVTLEVKVVAVVSGEVVIVASVVVKDAKIVMHAQKASRK